MSRQHPAYRPIKHNQMFTKCETSMDFSMFISDFTLQMQCDIWVWRGEVPQEILTMRLCCGRQVGVVCTWPKLDNTGGGCYCDYWLLRIRWYQETCSHGIKAWDWAGGTFLRESQIPPHGYGAKSEINTEKIQVLDMNVSVGLSMLGLRSCWCLPVVIPSHYNKFEASFPSHQPNVISTVWIIIVCWHVVRDIRILDRGQYCNILNHAQAHNLELLLPNCNLQPWISLGYNN